MEHWLDRTARDAASARISRREVLVRGARALAGGALLGGGWELLHAPRARGAACGTAAAPECVDVAAEAAAVAHAACAAEAPGQRLACLSKALNTHDNALARCLHDHHANAGCGPCEICSDGECFKTCVLSCRACAGDQGCVDTCPEDQFCDRLTGDHGGCAPKCPSPCAPWDSATKTCKDQCAAENPCMACRQGQCQSNCPDPADSCQPDGTCKPCSTARCETLVDGRCVGCDPECEICQDGSCVSTCESGLTCCLGTCRRCCGGTCDRSSGLCTNHECSPEETCCSGNCYDLQNDDAHCGACAHACPLGEHCFQGVCAQDCTTAGCPANFTCCQTAPRTHRCVDTHSDPKHCGDCFTACTSPQTCVGGTCNHCNPPCGAGLTCCGGVCVDLQNDFSNCGACEHACPVDKPQCVAGTCQICPSNALPCDPDYTSGNSCCFDPDDACCHSHDFATGEAIDQCYESSFDQCCDVGGTCPVSWTCYSGCACCPPRTTCCVNGQCIQGANGCG